MFAIRKDVIMIYRGCCIKVDSTENIIWVSQYLLLLGCSEYRSVLVSAHPAFRISLWPEHAQLTCTAGNTTQIRHLQYLCATTPSCSEIP